jgi:hypothetical protein
MAEGQAGVVRAGAKLLWRRQRILWWVYAINLALAFMGTLPVARSLSKVLDRSLAAERLYKGFDVTLFAELISPPRLPLRPLAAGSFFLAVLFFLVMLFLTGGILEVYRLDRTLTSGEFFQACGTMFWRFLRLVLMMLIPLAPIVILFSGVWRWSGKLASDASREMLGFWVQVGGTIVALFLLLAVRLWFDIAQVWAVAESESRMRRVLVRASGLTFGNFATLFWVYLRILLVAAVGMAVALGVWVKFVRPEWVGVSFLLGQAVLLLWLTARLWLRASETAWFQRYGPAYSADYLDRLVA